MSDREELQEWLEATHSGPLDETMLYWLIQRGEREEDTDERGHQIYEGFVRNWLERYPDPPLSRSATGMTSEDVLETARQESANIRKLVRRTLAQFELQTVFDCWQFELIADLYLHIRALDDLLADAHRNQRRDGGEA